MPGSVKLTVAELEEAVERRDRYLAVFVSGLDVGEEAQVKIVFDPVRTGAVKRSKLIRLSGLANAAASELSIGD